MKFTVDRDIMQSLLSKAAGTVSNKDIQPILKNFLIKAEGDQLAVLSTDNSLGALAELSPVIIDEEGTICVPAKKLVDMVSTSPAGMIRFELSKQTMVIHTAYSDKDASGLPLEKVKFKNKWELHCEDGALYPEFPVFDETKATACPRDTFVAGINRIVFAAADDELKLNLMGVYITENYMYAADGHTAAKLKYESGLREVMIPAPAVKMLVSVLRGSQAPEVKVVKTRFHLLFKVGSDVYHTRLLESKFPDIEARVFSQTKNYDATLRLKRDELRKAVKRATITASEESHQLVFTWKDYGCKIQSQNNAEDKFEETLEFADWDGDDFDQAVNWQHLNDVLAALSKEEVVIHMTKSVSAKTIFHFEEDDFNAIVMPLRLKKDADGNVERVHPRIKSHVDAKEVNTSLGQ